MEGGIGRAACTSTIYTSIAQTSVVANVHAAPVTGDTDLAVVDHEGRAIAGQQVAVLPLCHRAESRSWSKHGPTLQLWIQYASRQRSHCVLGYSYRREETLTYEVAEAAICADQVQARSARPSLHLAIVVHSNCGARKSDDDPTRFQAHPRTTCRAPLQSAASPAGRVCAPKRARRPADPPASRNPPGTAA